MNNMSELKYKVGDRVRIKNIDWFRNEGPNNMVVAYMKKYYGEVVTIKSVHKDFYRIKEDDWQYCWTDEMIECKVEEKIKPKFKVGDKVRIKSIDWYNENKDKDGIIDCSNANFIPNMKIYCGDILTICDINDELSYYYMTGCNYAFKDEMIEGLAEELLDKQMEEHQRICDEIMNIQGIEPIEVEMEEVWYCPEGYVFKDENGNIINATKIVLEKKEKSYPKTYEECCKVLNLTKYPPALAPNKHMFISQYNDFPHYYEVQKLAELLICRDAYWKIAGDEMGLGKPWEPDWKDGTTHKFIIHTIKDEIRCGVSLVKNHILSFPTEEMRDAFYENFKVEIESCKEFL